MIFSRKIVNSINTYLKRPIIYKLFQMQNEWFRKPPYVYSYYGYKVYYPPRDDLIYLLATDGSYEQGLLNACQKLLKDDAVILDVGAHLGLITLALSRILPKAHFHCFEPSPQTFRLLKTTVRKNILSKRIFLNNIAIFKSKDTSTFFVHRAKEASIDSINIQTGLKMIKKIKVKTTTIDSYVKSLNLQKVDAIKIDAEGAELDILKSSLITLKKFKPAIFFETWPEAAGLFGISMKDIYNFFSGNGYAVFTQKIKRLNLDNFLDATRSESNFISLPKS